jgi:hypothetical protein
VGTLTASLNYLSADITTYTAEMLDSPFGNHEDPPYPIISLTNYTGVVVGTGLAAGNYYRYRSIIGLNIPMGTEIPFGVLTLGAEIGGGSYNLEYYLNPAVSNPPVAADWFAAGTGTFLVAQTAAQAAAIIPQSIVVPASRLAIGMNYVYVYCDTDLANNPGNNWAYNLSVQLRIPS